MATVVERSTDGGTSWTGIDYDDFRIDVPLSDVGLAPTATIQSNVRETVNPGDLLRIQMDGVTKFIGECESGGTKQERGGLKIEARHQAIELFEEEVSFTYTGTDENVLQTALDNASSGGDFTLSYNVTNVLLDNTYECENRPVKQVFRDMMDRSGHVWWIDPAGMTINVESRDYRGQWRDLDSSTDDISVMSYDEGNVETVRNDVTVIGTGSVAVIGRATDQTSIDTHGRRTGDSPYNVDYITTESEANAYADSILSPSPLAEAKVLVGKTVGDVSEPLVNYSVGLTDDSKGISASGLTVEKQVIQQGRATLHVGQGAGAPVAEVNRKAKSRDDLTAPGTVMPQSRIEDGAIANQKIKDLAVDANKIADRAVNDAKIEISGIIAENLADSAVERRAIANAAINGEKVETGSIGASRLFITDWIPVGLSFTDNDPNAGEVSWTSHSLVYEGTEYSISSGSTSAEYIYWVEGNTSYSTSSTKPSLADGDALVCINDGGTANQILQATEIHGGSIRTNTIQAAEIDAGAITTDLLAAEAITVGKFSPDAFDADNFDLDNTNGVVITENGVGATEIAADSVSANEIAASTITASEISTLDLLTGQLSVSVDGASGELQFESFDAGGSGGAIRMDPKNGLTFDIGTINEIAQLDSTNLNISGLADINIVEPIDGDNSGSVGRDPSVGAAYAEVWAYNYYDASTGSTINDGGDPLTGLADGHGPPDHACRTDDEGREVGMSMGEALRSAWDVCRAQQRRVEALEETVADLEERLSALESDDATGA